MLSDGTVVSQIASFKNIFLVVTNVLIIFPLSDYLLLPIFFSEYVKLLSAQVSRAKGTPCFAQCLVTRGTMLAIRLQNIVQSIGQHSKNPRVPPYRPKCGRLQYLPTRR